MFAMASFTGCSNDYEIFATVYGTISDSSTGEPIMNANVTLSPSGEIKSTDVKGAYVFENLDAGDYQILVQKEGYEPDHRYIEAIGGERKKADFVLKKR